MRNRRHHSDNHDILVGSQGIDALNGGAGVDAASWKLNGALALAISRLHP